jgi:hypothetical protein
MRVRRTLDANHQGGKRHGRVRPLVTARYSINFVLRLVPVDGVSALQNPDAADGGFGSRAVILGVSILRHCNESTLWADGVDKVCEATVETLCLSFGGQLSPSLLIAPVGGDDLDASDPHLRQLTLTQRMRSSHWMAVARYGWQGF